MILLALLLLLMMMMLLLMLLWRASFGRRLWTGVRRRQRANAVHARDGAVPDGRGKLLHERLAAGCSTACGGR